MANSWFRFKQFTIQQDMCAMKVTTDACLFGAWVAERVDSRESIGDGRESGIHRILDIGTGTGLLSLMMAQKINGIIDAVELDKDAFEQAKENACCSPWGKRINIIHTDARVHEFSALYDTIISNPPFYENEWKSDDQKKNIAHHSNDLLLEEVLILIKKNLNPGGSFFLLLPFKRQEEIKKLLVEHKMAVEQIVFVRQSVNHEYFRIMIKGKSNPADTNETMIDEIAIKDATDVYTPAFVHLLKDYYLHL